MYFEKIIPITTVALALLAVSLGVNAASLEPGGQVAGRVNEQPAMLPGSTLRDCPTCPEMVVIPAGSFEMGEAYKTHPVTFSQPFAIGKFEVTQAQWKSIMGANPSIFRNCGDNCPVENVSWNDAQEFIQKLNARTGKQYRLPSEAEWEAACRGGERLQYCGSNDAQSVAWYDDAGTHPVGRKQANGFGMYDMSGNVWEWVEDGWHKNYEGAPSDGTAWQGNDSRHVIRGGSWLFDQWIIDAVDRRWNMPSDRYGTLGFRLARTLP